MLKHCSNIFFALVFSLLLFSCNTEGNPPNVLFILVDDLGYTDLACYGSSFHETPNIDKLAAESMLFTNAYAACPVCSPTRAAIMTGKYPTRLNITDWIPGDDPGNRKLLGTADKNELSLDELTLAEAMKENGYKTFFAGKWHLGNEGYFPEDQGFDINIGGHHRGSPPGGYYTPYKNPKLADGPEGEYLTDRLTDESIHFISKNRSDPFFLFLSFYTVHTPIQANRKEVERYNNKLKEMGYPEIRRETEHQAFTTLDQLNADYASMLHALDANIGRLMRALDSLGLTENTIIIFTSDNGGLTTLTNPNWIAPTSVRPLRAGKGWCYEGGIRVPLIIKLPGQTDPSISDVPVISMDFYPSILEMAGLELMPQQHLDGMSLLPLFDGKIEFTREELFWHYPHYHTSGWTPGAAIRSGNWKLIKFYESGITELYNLADDPGEQTNLTDIYPEITRVLKNKLIEMQEATLAKFPKNNPDFGVEDTR